MIQVLEEEGLTVTTLDMKAQPTRRLGRQSDLVFIEGLLRDGTRLLTLTGPAGVGKLRLAVGMGRRVSGEFARGVAFVDLSPIRDPSRVPPAVAAGVGLHKAESPSLPKRLFAYRKVRECLVVLDNFEQVTPAAPCIAELLQCPAVTLLATSREALPSASSKSTTTCARHSGGYLRWASTVWVAQPQLNEI